MFSYCSSSYPQVGSIRIDKSEETEEMDWQIRGDGIRGNGCGDDYLALRGIHIYF